MAYGGAAARAIFIILVGLVAGCASNTQSASICGFRFASAAAFLGLPGTAEAFDRSAGRDYCQSVPGEVGDPAASPIDMTAPEAEPDVPQPPFEVNPKLFVPSG
jgi:hypothetical protein